MQAKSAKGPWFLVIFRAFEMEKNYEMKQKEILKIYALFSFFFFITYHTVVNHICRLQMALFQEQSHCK